MTKRKIYISGLGLVFVLTLFMLDFPARTQEHDIRYIGIPDAAAGLVLQYVLKEKMGQHAIRMIRYEPYVLHDCCATASQYALSSGRIDIAVMCPEAAGILVAKDLRYEILGPVIQNSDVLITRTGAEPSDIRIAVSQKRNFQRQMVLQRFGRNSRPVPMLHAGVPFAYTRGVVQGAVVDITRAFWLEGILSQATGRGQNINTYVMVIKKSLKSTEVFQNFMQIYGLAVRETENSEQLLQLFQTYISKEYTMKEVSVWKKLNIHFTLPLNSPPQG